VYETLINLDDEKRERIINAGMHEFALKGYKSASTNEIVKAAGISKGLLFHYFGNKLSFYFYLIDYARTIFIEEFYQRLNDNETDIIMRRRQIMLLKIELIRKHPDMYDFMLSASADDTPEVKQKIDQIYHTTLEESMSKILLNIDASCLKKGTDVKRVSDIIIWVVEGFANVELGKMKNIPGYRSGFDLNVISADFDRYLDLLMQAFYAKP
jgi:TetR/AcrR family transcriptional regulator